jgi:hypothetical protein
MGGKENKNEKATMQGTNDTSKSVDHQKTSRCLRMSKKALIDYENLGKLINQGYRAAGSAGQRL